MINIHSILNINASIIIIKNKGHGAGCKNTNINGKTFEDKTSIEDKLYKNNFVKILINSNKFGYYLQYKNIIYLTQSGFKLYIKQIFNIPIYREPDEVFLIKKDNIYYIKILEKKNQNVSGSVEDKLKTGEFNRREYIKMTEHNNYNFIIEYAFCVSIYLQIKLNSNKLKYINIKKIMKEDNIKLFYGDDINYFNNIYNWINS